MKDSSLILGVVVVGVMGWFVYGVYKNGGAFSASGLSCPLGQAPGQGIRWVYRFSFLSLGFVCRLLLVVVLL